MCPKVLVAENFLMGREIMKKLGLLLLMTVGFEIAVSPAFALPQFARKYSFDCSTCHWPNYPKLNKFGYEFRAAGYRPPADIGKSDSDKFDWENTSSIKVENALTYTNTNDTAASMTTSHIEFTGPGVDLMPMTGSFAGNWATSVDFMISPGMTPDIGRAFLKYVAGEEKVFFTARFGVFDPFEGYGASDATILLSDPLALSSGTDMIPFTLLDGQYGLELGFTHMDTRVTFSVFNGLSSDGMGGGSEITGGSDHEQKDVLAFLNQFIGDDGLAFSGYFYDGYFMSTEFVRGALFATVPVGKSLEVLAGGVWGSDNIPGAPVTSIGGFGELEAALGEITTASLRYDYFQKDNSQTQGDIQAGTLGVNVLLDTHIKWGTQYQLALTNQPGGTLYAHSVQSLVTVLY